MKNLNIQSIFSNNNFFDEISIIDPNGIIQYCELFVPDVYGFTADEIIGKHIFDVFTSSNEENSEIYEVIRTKKPIISYVDNFMTYKNDMVKGYCSIYPIFKGDEFLGVALALKFIDDNLGNEFIRVFDNEKSIKSRGTSNYTIDDIITSDPSMLNIKRKILKVSRNDSNVMIQGSTGTGKEMVAQSIHYSSNRADKPFISQNCSAIPPTLMESILFGTEKGSFTGAVTNKGLFELADGGTLFFDEINSLDISLQAKLLKAIEEKSIRRIGGHENIKVDIRIIAALNEDPFDAIRKKHLRQDLYYRLGVVFLSLSDLKDRKEDIILLTEHFIDYFNRVMNKEIIGLESSLELAFQNHSWPGNVRELRNVIEGAFNFAEGNLLTLEDTPRHFLHVHSRDQESMYANFTDINKLFESGTNFNYEDSMAIYEKSILQHALDSTVSKKDAAQKLNMSKQALNYKLNKFNMI